MNLSAADIGSDIATSQVLLNYCSCVFDQSEASGLPFYQRRPLLHLHTKTLPVEPGRVVIELRLAEAADAALLTSLED